MEDSNTCIPLNFVKPISHSKYPPWKLLKPEMNTSLSEFQKAEKNRSKCG